MNHWNVRTWILTGLLIVAAVLAYGRAMTNGWGWRDDDAISSKLTAGSPGAIWAHPSAEGSYAPLTTTTFWAERRLWAKPAQENGAVGSHIVNVLLHVLCVVLAWRVLVMLGMPGAFLAAALFALHPIQATTVAWISQRAMLLSAAFALGSAWAILRFTLSPAPRDWSYCWVATVLFLLALLSSPMVALLPAGLLILIWWKQPNEPRPVIGTLAAWGGFGLLWLIFSASLEPPASWPLEANGSLSVLDWFVIAGQACWVYVSRLAAPWTLQFAYGLNGADRLTAWIWPIGVLLIVGGLWAFRRTIGRGPLAAAVWFLALLAPSFGFVEHRFLSVSLAGESFVYLASLGLFALVAAGVVRGAKALWRGSPGFAGPAGRPAEILGAPPSLGATFSVVGLTVILAVLLAFATRARTAPFKSADAMWTNAAERNPQSAIAPSELGNWWARQADRARLTRMQSGVDYDWKRALVYYKDALKLREDSAVLHDQCGLALSALGFADDARNEFTRALALCPKRDGTRSSLLAHIYVDRAVSFPLTIQRGLPPLLMKELTAERWKKIGEDLEQAIRWDDRYGLAYFHRGKSKLLRIDYATDPVGEQAKQRRREQHDDVIADYEQAIRCGGDAVAAAYDGLGVVHRLIAFGRVREILYLSPQADVISTFIYMKNDPEIADQLQEALDDHSRALEFDPTFAEAHAGRAWIYLLQGDFENAMKEQQEAEDLGATTPDLKSQLERRIGG